MSPANLEMSARRFSNGCFRVGGAGVVGAIDTSGGDAAAAVAVFVLRKSRKLKFTTRGEFGFDATLIYRIAVL